MFLHGSIAHLAGNLLFLWIFGNNIEDRLGRVRFLGFYLVGGVVATLTHVLLDVQSTIPMVGASGAIAAVMGAYLMWFPDAPVRTAIFLGIPWIVRIRAKWVLWLWFVLQFLTSPNSGVAWAAHVGGFVFGMVVGLLIRVVPRPPPGGDGPRPPRRPVGQHRHALRLVGSLAPTAEQLVDHGGEVRGHQVRRRVEVVDVAGTGRSAQHEREAVAERAGPGRRRCRRRSPTTTPSSPSRARTRSAIGPFGLPATTGVTPEATATAARIAPPPGIRPVRRREGRVVVGPDQAGASPDGGRPLGAGAS